MSPFDDVIIISYTGQWPYCEVCVRAVISKCVDIVPGSYSQHNTKPGYTTLLIQSIDRLYHSIWFGFALRHWALFICIVYSCISHVFVSARSLIEISRQHICLGCHYSVNVPDMSDFSGITDGCLTRDCQIPTSLYGVVWQMVNVSITLVHRKCIIHSWFIIRNYLQNAIHFSFELGKTQHEIFETLYKTVLDHTLE